MKLYKCICHVGSFYMENNNIPVLVVARNIGVAEDLAIAEMKRRRLSGNAYVKSTQLLATNANDYKVNILVVEEK